MYYTERKPKNKKRGRPGNEASIIHCIHQLTIITCRLMHWCITMILVLLFDPFVCIGCGGATNEKSMLPLLSV